MKKRYIVRKLVVASSARQAIALESRYPVEDVVIDLDYSDPDREIGFQKNERKNR
jgi:hypothetical protein